MPLVSVLMPVFNRETLVVDAIRSIQNQTFADWELIILDDCSTDRTLETCRSFEMQDKRIHVFANEQNLGVGQTRNRLLSFATGKYIAVQDSDDVSVPERLAWEVDVLEAKPEVGLVTGLAAMLDDDGRILTYYPQRLYRGERFPQQKAEIVELLYLHSGFENPSCMFRRSLLDKIPDPYGNFRIAEDWYFFVHMAHMTLILGVPRVMITMRRGKTHTHLGKDQATAQIQALQARRAIYQYYKDDPESPIDYWLYRKSMATSLLWRSRVFGGWKGYCNIVKALTYHPLNWRAWNLLWNFSGRAIRKAMRIVFKRKNKFANVTG